MIGSEFAAAFLSEVLKQAEKKRLLSREHCTVDGLLIEPQGRLYRNGNNLEAKLCYQGHLFMENRHGLIVDTQVATTSGAGEREAALEMMTSPPL